ncbi:MAG: tyrosine-type recombinase/integrase [Clostridia bacterium]|nr:tyrosine-type recombinase/integrase [Clostridia bacterium]
MKQISKELMQNFKDYLHDEEKSAATLDKYIRDVGTFAQWCGETELTKGLVLEYKQKLIERYAPASVNSIISSLNSFFGFNRWYDLKVKQLKIQKQIFADKEKELTKGEYERLLAAAKAQNNERLYCLMQTIGSTGIRISELKFVTAEAVNSGQATINCKGKLRRVFLPKQLCKMLKVYIKERKIKSGSVFVSKNGKPLDRSNIWSVMKKLCDAAGVSRDKVFPHNLRHLFARTYYSLKKDIVRLADILGHSSVNTTRIYTMETGEIHRRQIQSLGLVKMVC